MLIGKDIRLAQYEPSDAALLVEWLNDPQYWGPFYNVWTSTRSDWEAQLAKAADDQKSLSFVMRAREDDRPLGTIGYFTPFTLNNLHRAIEIWFQVHPRERQRGTGRQAAAILVNHLFSALPIERVQATVVDGNLGSCRVLETIGMQREGMLRDLFFLRGRYVDLLMYSIVRRDWKSENEYEKRFDFLAVPQ